MHTPPPSPKPSTIPTPRSVADLSATWTPTDFARSMSARTHKPCHSVQIYSLIYLGASHILLLSQPNPTNRFSPTLSLPLHEVFVPSGEDSTTIGELASLTVQYQVNVPTLSKGEYAGHFVSRDDKGHESAVVAVIFRVVDKEVIAGFMEVVNEDKGDWGAKYIGPEVVSRERAEKMESIGFGKLKRGVMAGFGYRIHS